MVGAHCKRAITNSISMLITWRFKSQVLCSQLFVLIKLLSCVIVQFVRFLLPQILQDAVIAKVNAVLQGYFWIC